MAKKKTEQAVAAPVAETVSNIDYIKLPITDIRASHTNRKRFPEETLRELSESIKKAGVMQPILVRPVTPTEAEPEPFEIVAGERRWRASKLAGLTDIPASVRSLNDQEAAELQILENLHRENPHELEEALGYQNLMMQHGYSADDLVAKLGKSRSYIYARLKLCALTLDLHDDFYSGKLCASTALDIARLPSPGLQKKAAELIFNAQTGEYIAARAAKNTIQNRLFKDLAKAKFPVTIKIAKLDSKGHYPACTKCPHKAGNQPEIFADTNPDFCTDADCFDLKTAAHRANQLAAFKKSGTPIYSADEEAIDIPSNLITEDKHLNYNFARIIEGGWRSIKDALPAESLPKPAGILITNGAEHLLYDKSEVQAALEKANLAYPAPPADDDANENIRETEKTKLREQEQERKRQAQLRQAQEDKAEAQFETNLRAYVYLTTREALAKSINVRREAVKAIINALDRCIDLSLEHVSHLYKFDVDRKGAIENHIQQCDDAGLLQVLLDAAFANEIDVAPQCLDEVNTDDDVMMLLNPAAEEAGIDIEAARKKFAGKNDDTAPTPDQAKPVTNWPFPTQAENATPVDTPVEPFKRPLLSLPKHKKQQAPKGPTEGDLQLDQMLIEAEGAV